MQKTEIGADELRARQAKVLQKVEQELVQE